MTDKTDDTGGFTNEGLEIESENNNVDLSDKNSEPKIFESVPNSENKIQISRPHYDQEKFHSEFDYNKPDKDPGEKIHV
jgi:hypothetical protein